MKAITRWLKKTGDPGTRHRLASFAVSWLSICLAAWPLAITVPLLRERVYVFVTIFFFALSMVLRSQDKIHFSFRTLYNPCLLFVGYQVLSFLFFFQKYASMTYIQIAEICAACIFYYVVFALLTRAEYYAKLMRLLVFLTACLMTVLIIEHLFIFKSYFLTPFFSAAGYQNKGYAYKNQLAFFLSLIFPFSYAYFSNKKTLSVLCALAPIWMAVLYTLSRMAVVLNVWSIILFCIFSRQRKMYIIQTAVLGCIVLVLNVLFDIGPKTFLDLKFKGWEASSDIAIVPDKRNKLTWSIPETSGRGQYIKQALTGFSEKPVFGHGFGSFRLNNPEYTKDGVLIRLPVTHNDYAQILYELGSAGFFLFLWFVMDAFLSLLKTRKTVSQSHAWVWEGQTVSFTILLTSFLAINVYQSIPFWFILAGSKSFSNFFKISSHEVKVAQTKTHIIPS